MCERARARRRRCSGPRCSRPPQEALPPAPSPCTRRRRPHRRRRARRRSPGRRGGRAAQAALPFASPHQGSPHVRARLLHPPRGGGDERVVVALDALLDLAAELLPIFTPQVRRSGASQQQRLSGASGIRLVFSRSCTEMAGRLSVIALTRDRPNGGGRPRSPRTESGGGGGILGRFGTRRDFVPPMEKRMLEAQRHLHHHRMRAAGCGTGKGRAPTGGSRSRPRVVEPGAALQATVGELRRLGPWRGPVQAGVPGPLQLLLHAPPAAGRGPPDLRRAARTICRSVRRLRRVRILVTRMQGVFRKGQRGPAGKEDAGRGPTGDRRGDPGAELPAAYPHVWKRRARRHGPGLRPPGHLRDAHGQPELPRPPAVEQVLLHGGRAAHVHAAGRPGRLRGGPREPPEALGGLPAALQRCTRAWRASGTRGAASCRGSPGRWRGPSR